MKYDIEVIINTDVGIGYGNVYKSADGPYNYNGNMYQSRLCNKLLKAGANDDDLIDNIANGKSYFIEKNSKVAAIYEILDFYNVNHDRKLPEIKKYDSFQDAIKYMKDNKLDYYIFHF